ncbi:MAG: hypothetical protein LRZ98_00785 [Candidatus Pacebacteria bacterium]|nr:hypothetical protein [Candidatus Paceibacterota bacterium]
MKEFKFNTGIHILEVLKETDLISSKKEGKRKIDEGAVQINGRKILDYFFKFSKGEFVLKLGKKMIKIKIIN